MDLLSRYGIRYFWFALVLFSPLNLAAQDWRGWALEGGHVESVFIYQAEGGTFSLALRGTQAVFPAEAARTGTIFLERSGVVHTGAGTTLTIRFAPSGTMILMSENTSLIYNGIDEAGRFVDIGLLYGRVRVLSGEMGLDGIRSIVVRCGRVSARVIEGDMGVDYLLEPDTPVFTTMPLFRLDAFRGNAEVFSHGEGGAAAHFGVLQTLTVQEGESLSLDMSGGQAFAERRPLRTEIVNYWNFRNFAVIPPIPDTVVQQEFTLVSAFGPPPFIQPQPTMNRNLARNLFFGLGFGLIAAAVAVQGTAHYAPDVFPDNTATFIHAGAYGALGFGAFFALIGMLLSSSSPAR